MLSLVLARDLVGRRLRLGKLNKGYFMIASIKLPQILHINPRKDIMHRNATVSLALCFTVSFPLTYFVVY